MGYRLHLKKHVVPHKFCSLNIKESQLTSCAKKRKLEFQKSLQKQTSYSAEVPFATETPTSTPEMLICIKRKVLKSAKKVTTANIVQSNDNVSEMVIHSESENFQVDSISADEKISFVVQTDFLGNSQMVIIQLSINF